MEPEWTKAIPSKLVCDYYYVLFVINAVIAAFAIVALPIMLFTMKMPVSMLMLHAFQVIIMAALAIIGSLSLYLLCDRSLLKGQGQEAQRQA